MDTLQTNNTSLHDKQSLGFTLGYVLFIVTLLVYPYVFILHHFFPNTYSFGEEKSLAVAIVTLFIILAFLLQAKNIVTKLGKNDLIFYCFIFISLLAVRLVVYQEEAAVLLKYRMFIFPIVYAGAACYYLNNEQRKILVQKIIIYQTVIQALFGIFLWNFVYSGIINLHIFQLWEGGGRMVGTLMSSNLFPGFLLIGAFIIISPYSKLRLRHWHKITMLIILTVAIIYSNSRWPSLMAIIILLLAFKDVFLTASSYTEKTIVITLIATVFLASSLLLAGAFQQTVDRAVNDDPNLRLIKYELGLNNVLDNSLNGIFIGTSQEKMSSRTMVVSEEGLKFSDNSYILMMELLGILITLLYIFIFASIIGKTCVVAGNTLIIFYFAASLFFNSAISWDFWIFFIFAALYSLQPNRDDNNQSIISTTHPLNQI